MQRRKLLEVAGPTAAVCPLSGLRHRLSGSLAARVRSFVQSINCQCVGHGCGVNVGVN